MGERDVSIDMPLCAGKTVTFEPRRLLSNDNSLLLVTNRGNQAFLACYDVTGVPTNRRLQAGLKGGSNF